MLGKDFVPSCFVDTLFILSPKPKLPAKNSNQGGERSPDTAATPSARGSPRPRPQLSRGPSSSHFTVKHPKPRAADKMPRGTQVLRARSGTCGRVPLENPGSSDYIPGTERGLVRWLGGKRSCSSAMAGPPVP
ncbi:unnamed protein product [Pipistrellus nathusii]|uniref:Uncharacterized protein n=1 Tax=Pipistrellus nathusii TaxID=59473 RepID=A0ABP0A0F8_PIPNA